MEERTSNTSTQCRRGHARHSHWLAAMVTAAINLTSYPSSGVLVSQSPLFLPGFTFCFSLRIQ